MIQDVSMDQGGRLHDLFHELHLGESLYSVDDTAAATQDVRTWSQVWINVMKSSRLSRLDPVLHWDDVHRNPT
jgi:hypothetical protein